MTRAFSDPRDSRGATLLLALGFMLVGSLIVMALLSWTGNGLFQATQSSNSLNFRYAANAAVQIRMQDLRYRYQPSQTFATCPGWPITSSIAPAPTVSGGVSQQVTVYCSINTDETSANSRTITFDACPVTLSFDGACTLNPYLTAVVAYNDFDSSGNGNCSPTAITTCGQNMTIESWDEPS
jgi:hypothetical protein